MKFDLTFKRSYTVILTSLSLLLSTATLSETTTENTVSENAARLDQAAKQYVILGLELGQYDKDYVDAYLGPKEWQTKAAAKPRSKEQLASDIAALFATLSEMNVTDKELNVRFKALSRNVRAMDVRARMVNGETFSFAKEAELIYDVILPSFDFEQFDQALLEIDKLLPGEDSLASRMDAFKSTFDIPAEKLEKVIATAIDECRARSKAFIPMPERESFSLEYVTGKSWSGYNWYQGNNVSLMQINQDFPTKIDSALGLGCHEGYPGHHVWNVLVEEELIKQKGWIEFNLYPLFSPYGLIAEGSAEYGVSLAFAGNDKTEYEQRVLYPLAGIDADNAELLDDINQLAKLLRYSRIAIAQQYLDGEISRAEAVKRTVKYSLVSEKRAESSVSFIEQYRAYVLNYSIGEDMISDYIAARADTEVESWAEFKKLLTQLKTASDLTQ